MKSLFNDEKHDMSKENSDMLAPTITRLEGMHDLVSTTLKAASSLFSSSRGKTHSTVLRADDGPTFYGTACYDSYDHHGASHVLVGLRALPLQNSRSNVAPMTNVQLLSKHMQDVQETNDAVVKVCSRGCESGLIL